jgi:hypothetical protein
LAELKLVATVTGSSQPIAVFEDRRRTLHFAQRGACVGPASRITEISRDCVTVTTRVFRPAGRHEAEVSRVCMALAPRFIAELHADG